MPLRPCDRLGAVAALADRLAATDARARRHSAPRACHEAEIREHAPRRSSRRSSTPVFEGDEAFLWARERRPDVPLLVLAGHYDTVPAQDNVPGRIEDGAVHGLRRERHEGRRRGRARARARARRGRARPRRRRLCSSSAARSSRRRTTRCPALFDAAPLVLEADLAVLLEPTDLTIQAGCVGNLTARVTFHGVSGHSARPWLADNAIAPRDRGARAVAAARAARGDRSAACRSTRSSPSRGSRVAWPTTSSPTGRCDAQLSLPARPLAGRGRGLVRSLVPTDATVEIVGNSPPGAVVVDAPLVRAPPRTPATSRSSRSRPGRTSPTSRRAGSRRSTSGRAPRATRTPRRAGRGLVARARLRRAPRARARAASSVRACPSPPPSRSQATYPFVRLNEAAAARRARGPRGDRLRHGRPAGADRPGDPAGASRRRPRADGLPDGGGAAGAPRGDRGLDRAALRRRARSPTAT